ncbi:MAG: hypothetical protein PHS80_05765 [Methanothrix sp.]|nr:hypothetical protein [Methanothrix sp.]MDD4446922.1 hypothetical protein [Methanothrix sp.]
MLAEIELAFDPASDEAAAMHIDNKEKIITNDNRSRIIPNPPADMTQAQRMQIQLAPSEPLHLFAFFYISTFRN